MIRSYDYYNIHNTTKIPPVRTVICIKFKGLGMVIIMDERIIVQKTNEYVKNMCVHTYRNTFKNTA